MARPNDEGKMKAITVCQPYAELIARVGADGLPVKPLENRVWFTSYRGPLLIHAGKSRGWLDDCEAYGIDSSTLTFSAIVAAVDLVACLSVHAFSSWPARWNHLRRHQHANGPYCLVLENLRRLPTPVPCGGAQRLWVPEPDVIAAVEAQLAGMEVRT